MPAAFTPLANITLSASATSITFSSIGQGFSDLKLVCLPIYSGNTQLNMRFNGDNGANYENITMYGYNASAYSETAGIGYIYLGSTGSSDDGPTPTQSQADIMDYSATNKHKTVLVKTGRYLPSYVNQRTARSSVGRWKSTAAITQIVLYPDSGTFNAGSTFALYGIAG